MSGDDLSCAARESVGCQRPTVPLLVILMVGLPFLALSFADQGHTPWEASDLGESAPLVVSWLLTAGTLVFLWWCNAPKWVIIAFPFASLIALVLVDTYWPSHWYRDDLDQYVDDPDKYDSSTFWDGFSSQWSLLLGPLILCGFAVVAALGVGRGVRGGSGAMSVRTDLARLKDRHLWGGWAGVLLVVLLGLSLMIVAWLPDTS